MGGSSGGGTSGAGKAEWALYLETAHEDWLVGSSPTTMLDAQCVTAKMKTAFTANPYTGQDAFDPTDRLADMAVGVYGLNMLIGTVNGEISWETYLDKAGSLLRSMQEDIGLSDPDPNASSDIASAWIDPSPNAPADIIDNLAVDAHVDADMVAFADQLDIQVESEVLPRFEKGMLDINAVMSSAFVLGRANIEVGRNRDVAKHGSGLRYQVNLQRDEILGRAYMQDDQIAAASSDRESEALSRAHMQDDVVNAENVKVQNLINAETERSSRSLMLEGADQIMRLVGMRIEYERLATHLMVDYNRIGIVSEKEQFDKDVEWNSAEAKWDLEMYQYGANVLASISGGTSYPRADTPSMQSALGGALAGAAIGGQLSGGKPVGAGIGAIIGGIGGLLLKG